MFKPRYPHLCSPLKVGPLTLRNRMASAPTSLATLGPGGHPSLENIAYYELRAKGGACIVTMVLETRNSAHVAQIREELSSRDYPLL